MAQTEAIRGTHAYISLTDSDQEPAAFPSGGGECVGILRLAFDDVLDSRDQGRPTVAFAESHARQILDFWAAVRDRAATLVIHCNGGQCRSPAVAAAIERIETGQDDRWFRTKRPNIRVYRMILGEHFIRTERTAPGCDGPPPGGAPR
jgi:predicted protein tyrosine phosphatase